MTAVPKKRLSAGSVSLAEASRLLAELADQVDYACYACNHLCESERRRLRDVQHELAVLSARLRLHPWLNA